MVLKREDDDKCNNGFGCLSLLLQTLVATSPKKKKNVKKKRELNVLLSWDNETLVSPLQVYNKGICPDLYIKRSSPFENSATSSQPSFT